MKILSKLITREIIPPMMVSLTIFLFVLLMRTIAKLAKSLIENQYSLEEIGLLLLYSIPPLLGFVIPMGLLLGIILGLNRLSGDSEVISLLSGGVSPHTLMRPIFTLALIAWLANSFLLMEAVPWSNEQYQRIILEHTSEVINSEVNPRVFNENFPGFILFVNDVEASSGEWQQMFLFNQNDPENPSAILANSARLLESEASGSVDLEIDNFHSYSFPRRDLNDPTRVSRGGSTLFRLVEGQTLQDRVSGSEKDQAKRVPELLEDIRRDENKMVYRVTARNVGSRTRQMEVLMRVGDEHEARKTFDVPPTGENDQVYEVHLRLVPGYEQKPLTVRLAHEGEVVFEKNLSIDDFSERRLSYSIEQATDIDREFVLINSKLERIKTTSQWIEIHKKFALPFTCLIFAFLGMPLGLSSRRGGKAYGYVVGIGIFVAYWALLMRGENLAINEVLPPFLGVWLPNIVFGAIALILFLRKRAEIRLPGLSSFLLRVRSNQDYLSETLYGEENGELQRKDVAAAKDGVDTRGRSLKLGRGMKFPTILDRYIIKTFLSMFLLVFFAMYTIFTLVQYIDRSNEIQKNNVDPTIILDFFLYQAPETVYWIIPISALMATMICFGILSKHLEVTAFKSSGISIYRISSPVVVLAMLISLISFYNQDIVIPMVADDLAEVKSIISGGPPQTVRDPTNRWILAENKQSIYYFYQFDESAGQINELHIYDLDSSFNRLKRKIYAQQAIWTGDRWTTDRGWRIDYDSVESRTRQIRRTFSLPVPEDPSYFGQEIRPADQMSYAKLEDYIVNLKQYGLATTKEEFELNWKLAFPFLPLVMSLLGLPFAFTGVRGSGALSGIFISIFLVIIYWGMMTLFKALGETGYLPALLAAWSPNIVFLGIGTLLFISVKS